MIIETYLPQHSSCGKIVLVCVNHFVHRGGLCVVKGECGKRGVSERGMVIGGVW